MKPLTERDIFFEALDKPTPSSREAYLKAVCGNDSTLHRKVEELLKEHFSNDSLLAGSALKSAQTPEARTSAPVTPAQILGRYQLLEKIGEGGFGEVWMAEQREPVKRRVALKIIKPGMDTRQIVARFEVERQALAMMDHANIARIFDAGVTDNGRPYFVMELVRGIKITEYCDQYQLATRERLRLFILVCQAIQHAHQKGIIHRDIKPSNILVTLHDGVPVPKVIDFGIAKATHQELTDQTVFTQFQQFIGTPAYISPEQAEMSGLDVDTRADIYSLGVLLYELLVGQTPFDARAMMQGGLDALRQTIREKEPLRPSTRLKTLRANARTTASKCRQTEPAKLVHQLEGDLDWIVMKCLEKDRTRRYETANGLAADVQRHLANEPVVARPPSAAYRLQKTWQRNKLVFAAGTVVAVALVAGIGVSTWQAVVATQAKGVALDAQATAEASRRRAEAEQQRADVQARKASESEQRSRRLLYAAEMNLAQQSLKVNNLGRARRLLDRYKPTESGEEDLRGWEWRYLWKLTRSSALVTLTNRPTYGFSVSFSPDGTRLAVGWYDGRVDLWDVPSRRRVRALTDREHRHQGRVAFSPVRNLLAATSEPKMVTLYDFDSGQESRIWQVTDPGAWEVRDLVFSRDGTRLAIYAGVAYDNTTASTLVGDRVWVVNVATSRVECRYPTLYSRDNHFGTTQLSPDHRRLYLARSEASKYRYSIQCLDAATGQELWQSEPQRDFGLTTLALSPDGNLLASGSGYEDSIIRVWDAATGRLLRQLDGHTGWVSALVFTDNGRRLISAASDQSIRLWDTSTWTEIQPILRGHTDEIHAIAISEKAQLIASASKDGALMLWRLEEKETAAGYRRLPDHLGFKDVHPLDHSRVLVLPPGQPPELVDLKRDTPPMSVRELGPSSNVLGCFGTNIVCHWDGTNQIVVRELKGSALIQRGAITLHSVMRPAGFTFNPARQLLAWAEEHSPSSVYLASLAEPDRRIELKNNVPGLVQFRFSEDGNHLAACTQGFNSPRVWNIDSGLVVASIDTEIAAGGFAANGNAWVVSVPEGNHHQIRFYDLSHPNQLPKFVHGKDFCDHMAVSPDGGIVAASTGAGLVRLFHPTKGELIDELHGHLNGAQGVAFSPDGRRLISASGGREAVKLWDVGVPQELLTLAGSGSVLGQALWSADGDVILAGPPWQAWIAPSWEEIEAEESKQRAENQPP